MSSNTRVDFFYLTPGVWIEGTETPDTVETWRRTVSEDRGVSWQCEWVDLRKTRDHRDALRAEFHSFMKSAATAYLPEWETRQLVSASDQTAQSLIPAVPSLTSA